MWKWLSLCLYYNDEEQWNSNSNSRRLRCINNYWFLTWSFFAIVVIAPLFSFTAAALNFFLFSILADQIQTHSIAQSIERERERLQIEKRGSFWCKFYSDELQIFATLSSSNFHYYWILPFQQSPSFDDDDDGGGGNGGKGGACIWEMISSNQPQKDGVDSVVCLSHVQFPHTLSPSPLNSLDWEDGGKNRVVMWKLTKEQFCRPSSIMCA